MTHHRPPRQNAAQATVRAPGRTETDDQVRDRIRTAEAAYQARLEEPTPPTEECPYCEGSGRLDPHGDAVPRSALRLNPWVWLASVTLAPSTTARVLSRTLPCKEVVPVCAQAEEMDSRKKTGNKKTGNKKSRFWMEDFITASLRVCAMFCAGI